MCVNCGRLYQEVYLIWFHKIGTLHVLGRRRYQQQQRIVCKLMESIIRDKIMEHFLATGYFSDKQYGIIKGRFWHTDITGVFLLVEKWHISPQVHHVRTNKHKSWTKFLIRMVWCLLSATSEFISTLVLLWPPIFPGQCQIALLHLDKSVVFAGHFPCAWCHRSLQRLC